MANQSFKNGSPDPGDERREEARAPNPLTGIVSETNEARILQMRNKRAFIEARHEAARDILLDRKSSDEHFEKALEFLVASEHSGSEVHLEQVFETFVKRDSSGEEAALSKRTLRLGRVIAFKSDMAFSFLLPLASEGETDQLQLAALSSLYQVDDPRIRHAAVELSQNKNFLVAQTACALLLQVGDLVPGAVRSMLPREPVLDDLEFEAVTRHFLRRGFQSLDESFCAIADLNLEPEVKARNALLSNLTPAREAFVREVGATLSGRGPKNRLMRVLIVSETPESQRMIPETVREHPILGSLKLPNKEVQTKVKGLLRDAVEREPDRERRAEAFSSLCDQATAEDCDFICRRIADNYQQPSFYRNIEKYSIEADAPIDAENAIRVIQHFASVSARLSHRIERLKRPKDERDEPDKELIAQVQAACFLVQLSEHPQKQVMLEKALKIGYPEVRFRAALLLGPENDRAGKFMASSKGSQLFHQAIPINLAAAKGESALHPVQKSCEDWLLNYDSLMVPECVVEALQKVRLTHSSTIHVLSHRINNQVGEGNLETTLSIFQMGEDYWPVAFKTLAAVDPSQLTPQQRQMVLSAFMGLANSVRERRATTDEAVSQLRTLYRD